MVIIGRAIQGAGAISAVVTALVADSTREEHRTQAMAMIGATIGVTFAVSLVAGPILNQWIGVSGIFWPCYSSIYSTMISTFAYLFFIVLTNSKEGSVSYFTFLCKFANDNPRVLLSF